MYELIDTHAHLDEVEDIGAVLTEARKAGVKAIVCVGTGLTTNNRTLELGRTYGDILFPALGLHPWEIHGQSADSLNTVYKQIENNIDTICAIGEIGLDYNKHLLKLASKEQQKAVLMRLLEMAARYSKPVSLHSRYAWKDCFECVVRSGVREAVFHWFTGFSSVLYDILDHGFYISCTPAVEYHEEHRRAIKETPLDRLLLETDTPVTYGRESKYRAQPADVYRCLISISELKNIPADIVAQQTTQNAIRLFNLKV